MWLNHEHRRQRLFFSPTIEGLFAVFGTSVVCLEPVSLIVFDLACEGPLRVLYAIWMTYVATNLKYIVDKNVRMLYTARSQNLHLQQFIFRIS